MDPSIQQQELPEVSLKKSKFRHILDWFQGQHLLAKLSVLFLAIIALATPVFIAGRQIFNSHASNGQPTACIQPPSCVSQGTCPNIANTPGISWCGISLHTTVTVGDEEYVAGPLDNDLDMELFTVKSNNQVVAFTSNRFSYEYLGNSLETIPWHKPPHVAPTLLNPILFPGASGFDVSGAWLVSVYKLTDNHWIGWYHGERDDPTNGGGTHWYTAFTESFDGGKTWQKPNWPNNIVLSADSQYASIPKKDHFSGAKVLQIGDYFYMLSLGTDWNWYLARSKVSGMGKPGTWYKYYNGNFSEPGIRGHATPIQNADDSFTYNSYLNEYLTVSLKGGITGYHLKIASPNDLTTWTDLLNNDSIYPLVSYPNDPRVDNWQDRSPEEMQVYKYPSLINVDGDSFTTGQEFYLYYVKLFPGDDWTKRYLFRRKITLNKTNSQYLSTASLTRYQQQGSNKILVSTELAKPSEGYIKIQDIGKVLTYPTAGFKPLYLCYIPTYQEYMPTSVDPSKYNWQHCENPNGDIFVRTVGYISTLQTASTPIAIYRCFDPVKLNHFISTDSNCEGKQVNWKLGYIFPNSNSNSPSLTPTVTGSSLINGGIVSSTPPPQTTCTPRPACLKANPPCEINLPNMCPN